MDIDHPALQVTVVTRDRRLPIAKPRRLALWYAAALFGVVLSFAQVATTHPTRALWGWPQDLRVRAMRAVLEAEQFSDIGDMMPAITAARTLAREGGGRVYENSSTTGPAFIYPPIGALLYAPFVGLDEPTTKSRLVVQNRVLFVGIFLQVLLLLHRKGRSMPWREGVAAAVVLAIYYPLLRALALNQATVAITFLLGIAFVCLSRDKEHAAGIAFGIACLIKPHLLLALPLMAFASRRFVIGSLATGAVGLGLSLVYAGYANHVDYVTKVLPSLSAGYAFFPNHSWNGLFNRLFVMDDPDHFAVAPRIAAVTVLSLLASSATYVAGLLWVRRFRGAPTVWIFGFAWLVTALVSPVSWEHHYAPALFLFALVYVHFRDEVRVDRRMLVTTAGAFWLIASYFEVRHLDGAVPRLLVSYLFYGALLLTASSALILRRLSPRTAL